MRLKRSSFRNEYSCAIGLENLTLNLDNFKQYLYTLYYGITILFCRQFVDRALSLSVFLIIQTTELFKINSTHRQTSYIFIDGCATLKFGVTGDEKGLIGAQYYIFLSPAKVLGWGSLGLQKMIKVY